MILRAFAVWCGLLVLALINGAVRELWIRSKLGAWGSHFVSSITLSAAILAVAWATIDWVYVADVADAFVAGGFWLVLTLAFEFLAGHYFFRKSWGELLADYNLLRGRLWLLVLLTTALAPFLTAWQRGLLPL